MPDLVPTAGWRLAFPALALPAAAMLPAAIRRSGAQWLRWRLDALPHDRYEVMHRPPLPVALDGDCVEYVVLAPHGVFLIQCVDRGGRILGKPKDKIWAHKVPGGTTAFNNPLRLGRRRAAVLADAMDIDPDVLFPIVVFTGACKFDGAMPDNLTNPLGCLGRVRADTGVLLDDEELARIRACLEAGLDDPRWRACRERVRVRVPAGADVLRHDARPAAAATTGPVCPRCGAALGAYSYKTGARAGQMFSGCTRFPACGYRAYPVRKTAAALTASSCST